VLVPVLVTPVGVVVMTLVLCGVVVVVESCVKVDDSGRVNDSVGVVSVKVSVLALLRRLLSLVVLKVSVTEIFEELSGLLETKELEALAMVTVEFVGPVTTDAVDVGIDVLPSVVVARVVVDDDASGRRRVLVPPSFDPVVPVKVIPPSTLPRPPSP
jgi:hypothetical protein